MSCMVWHIITVPEIHKMMLMAKPMNIGCGGEVAQWESRSRSQVLKFHVQTFWTTHPHCEMLPCWTER